MMRRFLPALSVLAMVAIASLGVDYVNWGNASIDTSGNMHLGGYADVTGTVYAASVSASGAISGAAITGTSFTDAGNGPTSEVAGVTVTTTGAYLKKSIITITDVPIVIPFAGTGTNHIGATKLVTFPQGRVLVHGVTASGLKLSAHASLAATEGGDIAMGSTAVVTIDDNTAALAGTVVNILPSTSLDPITNAVTSALAASAQFDGTSTALPIYVSFQADTGDMTAASTNNVSGVVTIHWTDLGDY